MAKKRSTKTLSAGTRITVRDGVTVPEFDEVSCAGWTGTILETLGKKASLRYVIEWDESTINRMPPLYLQACEKQQLLHTMAYLNRDDFDVADAE